MSIPGQLMLCPDKGCPLSDNCSEVVLADSNCPAKAKLKHALATYFKFDAFRPGQLQAVLPVAHGKDVFVHMPTGGGKSLCMYLYPLAVSESAMGLIVSPLVGLMEQQVRHLNTVGVSAIRVSDKDQLADIEAGKFRFVFVSPETVQNQLFRSLLASKFFRKRLALVAVDEAHCVSDWGKDFRPSFSCLGGVRALNAAPFMALTASAPPSVKDDVIQSLHMRSPITVSVNLDRPNIYLSASPLKSLQRDFHGIVTSYKSLSCLNIPKTIVFGQTKNEVCKVYSLLSSSLGVNTVAMYHASLTQAYKQFLQQQFMRPDSQLRCLVATVAFGMGMDVPDVELVVVYGIPRTLSELYQLAGRAGRNGCPSRAHLLFSSRKKLKEPALGAFIKNKENCRRRHLLEAIGGSYLLSSCSRCCDICVPDEIPGRLDVLRPGPTNRKRKSPQKELNGKALRSLKSSLEAKRTSFINDHPEFLMIGSSFVCPDSTLLKLCTHALCITSAVDLAEYGIRTELRDPFFTVIRDLVRTLPPPEKRPHH